MTVRMRRYCSSSGRQLLTPCIKIGDPLERTEIYVCGGIGGGGGKPLPERKRVSQSLDDPKEKGKSARSGIGGFINEKTRALVEREDADLISDCPPGDRLRERKWKDKLSRKPEGGERGPQDSTRLEVITLAARSKKS